MRLQSRWGDPSESLTRAGSSVCRMAPPFTCLEAQNLSSSLAVAKRHGLSSQGPALGCLSPRWQLAFLWVCDPNKKAKRDSQHLWNLLLYVIYVAFTWVYPWDPSYPRERNYQTTRECILNYCHLQFEVEKRTKEKWVYKGRFWPRPLPFPSPLLSSSHCLMAAVFPFSPASVGSHSSSFLADTDWRHLLPLLQISSFHRKATTKLKWPLKL